MICSCLLYSPSFACFIYPSLHSLCFLLIPLVNCLGKNKYYLTSSWESWNYLSTSTMGPAHEPSPQKGEVKPTTTKMTPNVGPMVCGQSLVCLTYPAISLAPCSSIGWHRAAVWCPTSKVIWKLIPLTEKRQLNVWHFTDTWPPDFRQQAAAYSDFLPIQGKLYVFLLYNCISLQRKGQCLFTNGGHQGQCVWRSRVFPMGNNSKRPDSLRRKT